jgi:dimethylhistidine N-methyltransferase
MRRPRDLAIDRSSRFARDVYDGLTAAQKFVPAEYFYDAVGSALFEAITHLPEYGLTRAEERILRSHSVELANRVTPVNAVMELGSGSGWKTQHILASIAKQQSQVAYFAIDVSASALSACCDHLNRLRGVKASGVEASYLEGLASARAQISSEGRVLLLFLGSTIGNFADDQMFAFLRRLRKELRAGDAFLMGADLVKPSNQLLNAYDDAAGVTSAFNLNLLARINRELNGNFDLKKFRHEARWVKEKSRVEMHLVSRERQTVNVDAADCRVSFAVGESIWTESSRKFTLIELDRAAAECGFKCAQRWVDEEWPFAELLWIAT